MEVYIEDFIIYNFAMNFLVIYIALVISRKKITKLNMFIATIIAVICSILNLYIIKYLVIFKIATGFLISAFMTKCLNYKVIIKNFIYLLVSTNLVAILSIGSSNFLKDLGISLNDELNFIIAGIIALIIALFIKSLIYKLLRLRIQNNFTYEVTLENSGNRVVSKALLDSGNLLYDNNMHPVIILDKAIIDKLMLNSENECIYVSTINGEMMYKKYILESITINNKENFINCKNVSVISKGKGKNKNASIILHGELFT